MKKILVVGMLTQKTSDINQHISAYFSTQMCGDNPAVVDSMRNMFLPDLVFVNLEGLEPAKHGTIFESLTKTASLPVVTFGSENEKELFAGYCTSSQFVYSADTYSSEKVLALICKMLNVNPDETLNAGAAGEKHHILVVDDNAVLLRSMKTMLSDKYKVSLATSAAQCMKVLEKGGVELILLDYEMPDVDGRQTLEMIRAEDNLKDLPVFFLTGVQDKEHLDIIAELKTQGYFIKPPVQAKLTSAIDAVLGQ